MNFGLNINTLLSKADVSVEDGNDNLSTAGMAMQHTK